jgi:hypothetical protein
VNEIDGVGNARRTFSGRNEVRRSEWTGYPPVSSDPPEMPGYEDQHRTRQQNHVPYVRAENREISRCFGPEQQTRETRSRNRDCQDQVPGNRPSPQTPIVPDEEVTREIDEKRGHQKQHSNHPVETSRGRIRASDEDPDHVKSHKHYHDLPAPVMKVPNEEAVGNYVRDIQDGGICPGEGGNVMKHQQKTGDDLDNHHPECQSPQAPREAES